MLKFFENKRRISFLTTILIAIAIFFFSSIPGNSDMGIPEINILSIFYHFSIFFLLNFFLLTSFHGKQKPKLKYIAFAICITIIYAFLDELHQTFTPYRNPTLFDIIIDSIGILFSSIIYLKTKN